MHPSARHPRSEHGITLVEVMVVLLIVSIITSFGVLSLRASRTTGGTFEIAAAARTYADLVSRYQTDHGRKVPVLGSADWPSGQANAGPKRRLVVDGPAIERPYLQRAIPEVMTRTGPAGGQWRTAAPPASTRGGTLVYRRVSDYSFTITAYWNGARVCTAGDVPAATRRC